MTYDPVNFSKTLKETIMVISTLRAVAAACDPGVRLFANIRCDDIIRSIDEMMPLEEFYPGRVGKREPHHIYTRRDWRDGLPAEEVMMGIFDASRCHMSDALMAGPLLAGEVLNASFHLLTGCSLERNPEMKDENHEPN